MPRLRFDKTGERYFVYCRGENLGGIYFFDKWKEWVWEQSEDVIMSADCLEEVINFLKSLNPKQMGLIK